MNMINQQQNVLFVGDLPPACQEAELWQLFSSFGDVYNISLKQKGPEDNFSLYALIAFSDDISATTAMRHLNGMAYRGSHLKVRKATQMATNTAVAVSENIINSLYIKFTTREINYYITEADIFNVFSLFGTVTTVNIKDLNIDQSMQRQTGYGFVHFIGDREGTEQAMRACNTLNRSSRNGIFFNVELSKNFMKQFNGNKLDLPGGIRPPGTVHTRHPLGEFRADARSKISHPLMSAVGGVGGGGVGYDLPISYQHPLMQDTLSVASSGSGGRLPSYRAGRATSDPMTDSSVASGGSSKKYDIQHLDFPASYNNHPVNSMAPRSNFGWLTGAIDNDAFVQDPRLDTMSHNFSAQNYNSF